MRRDRSYLIGVFLFVIFILLAPLGLFPALQNKLDESAQNLETYNAIPEKSLTWQGRNAYLSVPTGTDEETVKAAVSDISSIRGVRSTVLVYTLPLVEAAEAAPTTEENNGAVKASEEDTGQDSSPIQEDLAEQQIEETQGQDEVNQNASLETEETDDEVISEILAEDFNPIIFEIGTSTLKEEANTTIESVASAMKENPDLMLQLIGHADAMGDEDKNERLSIERAQKVMERLIASGVDADRISIEGKGETEPVADNETVEGRQQNRRVELIGMEN